VPKPAQPAAVMGLNRALEGVPEGGVGPLDEAR
jgi:hypothetical protein